MNTLAALNMLVTLTSTLTELANHAQQISALIQKAQAEGRTELTAEEWALITGADDAARSALANAIVKSLGDGK